MSRKIAIFCYSVKQHFASHHDHTRLMGGQSINEVLAANLRYFMEKRNLLTQVALQKKSGVKQNTISLYLDPDKRKPNSSGKPAGGKLVEVEMLAKALDIEVWELLRPMTQEERAAYERIEAAFRAIKSDSPAIDKNNQESETERTN